MNIVPLTLSLLLLASAAAQTPPAQPAAQQPAPAKPAEPKPDAQKTDPAKTDPAKAEGTKPAAAASTFTAEQLEQIVAPIALHPDSLLSQILMASTYPLEIVKATR